MLHELKTIGNQRLRLSSIGEGGSTPPPTFNIVQQVNYSTSVAGTSHLITWNTTPINGNTLVLCVVSDNTSAIPAGYTQAVSGPDFTENKVSYRVASGESASVTVTTGVGHVCIVAFELSGLATPIPLDSVDFTPAQATPVSCGFTAYTSQPNMMLLSMVGISGATPTFVSWDNAMDARADIVSTGTGTLVRCIVATKQISVAGSYTANATLSSSGNSHNVGLILAFKRGGTSSTTLCIGPTATGNGSGSDWNNQKAWSGTFSRGDTWCLRGGSYGNVVFTSPTSGTIRNVIKKATAADHVTETGWSAAFGTDQATCGKVSINASNSGFWLFDGRKGLLNGTTIPYGLKFLQTVAGQQTFNFNLGGANTILKRIELAGPGGSTDFNHTADTACLSSWGGQATNLLVQHCYIHGGSTLLETIDFGTIIEHCYIADSRSNNVAAHSNVFFCGFSANGVTFRYNFCTNYNDEGFFITWFNNAASPPQQLRIYGNVFYSPGTTNPRGIEIRQFDGTGSGQVYNDILMYNNTFAELSSGGIRNRANEGGLGSSTNCAAVNNISYLATNNLGDTTTVLTNTDDSTNRFVAIGTNFHLTAALAGTVLASPYNIDPDGIIRGNDGTFDRGAFEFVT